MVPHQAQRRRGPPEQLRGDSAAFGVLKQPYRSRMVPRRARSRCGPPEQLRGDSAEFVILKRSSSIEHGSSSSTALTRPPRIMSGRPRCIWRPRAVISISHGSSSSTAPTWQPGTKTGRLRCMRAVIFSHGSSPTRPPRTALGRLRCIWRPQTVISISVPLARALSMKSNLICPKKTGNVSDYVSSYLGPQSFEKNRDPRSCIAIQFRDPLGPIDSSRPTTSVCHGLFS